MGDPNGITCYDALTNNNTNFDALLTDLNDSFHEFPLLSFNKTEVQNLYEIIRNRANQMIIPGLLVIGMFGNGFSLAIHSKRQLRRNLRGEETSAQIGLMFLSASDLLFCFTGAWNIIFSRHSFSGSTWDITGFYYHAYKGSLLNFFLFTSTWMIVVTAFERYIAICHPFRAHNVISTKSTLLVNGITIVTSLVLSLPEFLKVSVVESLCADGCHVCYMSVTQKPWFLQKHVSDIFRYLWFTIGTFIPLIILAFCNVRLILELQRSRRRSIHGMDDPVAKATNSLTVTLVTMVFAFIFFVCPSMVMNCLHPLAVNVMSTDDFYWFQIATVICNVLQAIKFSCNFVLYFCLNRRFREQLRPGRCCERVRTDKITNDKDKYELVVGSNNIHNV